MLKLILASSVTLVLLVSCTSFLPQGNEEVSITHISFDPYSHKISFTSVKTIQTSYFLKYGEDESSATLKVADSIEAAASKGTGKKAASSIWTAIISFATGLFMNRSGALPV